MQKKPIEKEIRAEEIGEEMSEGGDDSDNYGSEDGVPPEVALEDLREGAREAAIATAEQRGM